MQDGCERNMAGEGSNMSVLVMLDMRNAFNCVSHNAVLLTITNLGVPRYFHRMIRGYLGGRNLVCQARDEHVERHLYRGVSQGSVLGPTL